ncbi:hypothetical protein [Listeria innocua]|uniref:hypothetical protein n=1 Tax=Listeria innocua TaxID=1642 RepID=UPI00162A7C41|nr:hypothetical protein [Listeria innocua]MBC1385423.1 hypothetical protein [Listeria innocua]HAC4846971.1 hypothetical protein [Listeria monocytogenes]
MKSQLTEELYQLGFLCGFELEIYIRDTGKFTSLIIEGNRKGGDVLYRYDFYKQTFYPYYPNKVTVYGENMSASLLLNRVKQYLANRERYLADQ